MSAFSGSLVKMICVCPLKRTPPSYVVFVVTDVEKTGSTSKSGRFSGNAVTTRKVLGVSATSPLKGSVLFL